MGVATDRDPSCDVCRHACRAASTFAADGGRGILWVFSLLARTLPQARMLWTERDPREMGGDIELVEREA